MYVRQSGPHDAEPLLLLHSLGTQGAIWDAPAASLAQCYRVICPDLRGHGLIDITAGPYTVAGLARDAACLLDALGVSRARVAGFLWAAWWRKRWQRDRRKWCAALVLIGTALVIPPAQAWRDRAVAVCCCGMAHLTEMAVARWLVASSVQSPQADGLRAMLGRTDAEGYAASAEAIASADLNETTPGLRLPTLILVGDQDAATPLASAEALRHATPGSILQVIEPAAHIPSMEPVEQVSAAMRAFLATVS